MSFDFSRFLLAVERRSRRFRGLSLASRLLFYGSLACIAALLGLQWLAPGIGPRRMLLLLGIPIAFAFVAFIIGWWRRPHLPHLLMNLDESLGSSARISSLYEERARGRDSFFRHRLEELVAQIAADWKRGLRPPKRTFGFLSAGLVGILIACLIMLAPFPFPQILKM